MIKKSTNETKTLNIHTRYKIEHRPEAMKGEKTINEIAQLYEVHPNQVSAFGIKPSRVLAKKASYTRKSAS